MQEVLRRIQDAQDYITRQPPAAQALATHVRDANGRQLLYADQSASVGAGQQKKYDQYFTCGCCKCQGLAQPCTSTREGGGHCTNKACLLNPNSRKTTLEVWGRAKVQELSQ